MIHDITWSDHAVVSLRVEETSNGNFTYIWRSNPLLFQDGPSKLALQKELLNFFEHNVNSVADPFVTWNAHKAYMRCLLII